MLRSMYSGISGLRNFQTKLDVIGNNIANVNTYGFKKGRVAFQDLMSQQLQGASSPTDNRGGTNPRQVGLGATIATIDTIMTQGSMQTTGRSLDVGISGDGFFVVSNGNLNYYTRAGNFYLDQYGTLVNGEGLRVMGYAADEYGNIDLSQLTTLQIAAGTQVPPEKTTFSTFKGNLNADAEAADGTTPGAPARLDAAALTGEQVSEILKRSGVQVSYSVYDELGGEHTIDLFFQKTKANTWEVFTMEEVPPADPADPITYEFTSLEEIEFSEGKVEPLIDPLPTITIPDGGGELPNGANAFTFTLDFNSLRQFAGSNTVDIDRVDGYQEGFLESFNIGQTGEITGVYSNGQVRVLGQIAVATFDNPEGLNKTGNNTYQVSNNSGQPNIGVPGEGRGTLMGSSLEMSNVDLSEEFTEMIVAQRGFQANTRIITTSDEILQELVNLKR